MSVDDNKGDNKEGIRTVPCVPSCAARCAVSDVWRCLSRSAVLLGMPPCDRIASASVLGCAASAASISCFLASSTDPFTLQAHQHSVRHSAPGWPCSRRVKHPTPAQQTPTSPANKTRKH